MLYCGIVRGSIGGVLPTLDLTAHSKAWKLNNLLPWKSNIYINGLEIGPTQHILIGLIVWVI